MKQEKMSRIILASFLTVLLLALAGCTPSANPISIAPTMPSAPAAATATVPFVEYPLADVFNASSKPGLGPFLVDDKGMTLYFFKNDTPGISNCNDDCAKTWPPVMEDESPIGGTAVPGGFGLTTRNDGTQQATYNNLPLYHFSGDKKPGDTNGQGVDSEWTVVKP